MRRLRRLLMTTELVKLTKGAEGATVSWRILEFLAQLQQLCSKNKVSTEISDPLHGL